MFCFFSLSEMFGGVWAPCFLFRQVMNLKNPCHIAPSERKKKKKEDLIVPCYVHEAVNSFSRVGSIEQSDAHIVQSTVQTDRQLLGKMSYVSA